MTDKQSDGIEDVDFDPTGKQPHQIGGEDVDFDPSGKAPGELPMGWGDVAKSAVMSVPSSAGEFASSMAQPFLHPIETATNLKNIAHGVLEKSGLASSTGHEQYADALGKFIYDRYGSMDNFKKTLASDPVGVAADFSMVLTGGGSAAARAPGYLGRAAEIAQAAGRAIDPINAAASVTAPAARLAGRVAAETVGGLTHTGAAPVETAAHAGFEGGAAGQAFRENLRDQAPMSEAVDQARQAVQNIRLQRGQAYRTGMQGISANQMAYPGIWADIGNAARRAGAVKTFMGQDLSPSTRAVRQELADRITNWYQLPPSQYHTLEGFDALKQQIGDIRDATEYGTPARRIADEMYHGIRAAIVRADPEYGRIMGAYEGASHQLREIEKTLSLGGGRREGAVVDTALRKLQSTLRDNVNTSFGRRRELLQYLIDNGAPHLMEALAGQAMKPWLPRGLGRLGMQLGAEMVALAGGMAGAPHALALAPLGAAMSPRLMGEASYYSGVAARYLNAARRMTPARMSFQAGRLPTPLPRPALSGDQQTAEVRAPGGRAMADGGDPGDLDPAAEAEAARLAAAARMRGAVQPAEGREQGEFTEGLMNTMVPGRAALRAGMEGNWPAAAAEAVGSALPATRFLPDPVRRAGARAVAGGLGAMGLLAPSNTPAGAENSMFPFISDPIERSAADTAYNQIKVFRTNAAGRTLKNAQGQPLLDDNATAQRRSAFVTQTTQDYARKAATAREGQDLLKSFEEANAGTISGLTPAQRSEYEAAVTDTPQGTVLAKKDVLSKFAQEAQQKQREQERENLPFVQRYPDAAMAMEAAALGLGAAAPGHVAFKRAGVLRDLARAGEEAMKAGSSQKAQIARMHAANNLEKFLGLSAIDKTELLTAPMLPWGANTVAPAAIDAFRFGGDFSHPALQSDIKSLNPAEPTAWGRLGVNAAEGVFGTGAGLMGGSMARNFPNAWTQASATLKSLRDMQEAERAATAVRAATAKTSTKAAAKAKRTKAARQDIGPGPVMPIPPALMGPERAAGGRIPMWTRKEAHYDATGGKPDRHCGSDKQWRHGSCRKFRGPHGCSEVGGFIATKGVCDWWRAAREEDRATGGRAMAVGGSPDDLSPDLVVSQPYTVQMHQEPSYEPGEASQDAAEAAAARTRRSVQPAGGRGEGVATDITTQFVPTLARKMFEPLQQGADLMRRAYEEGNITSENPKDIAAAFNAAGAAAAGAMPFAQRGALGAFGGMPTYSAAGEAVRAARQQVMHPDQWLGFLKNQPGVKAQEIEHVGLEPWLKSQQGPVSREAVDQFIASKQPQLREVRKEGAPGLDADEAYQRAERQVLRNNPRLEDEGHADYQYRMRNEIERVAEQLQSGGDTKYSSRQLPGGSNYGETLLTLHPKEPKTEYKVRTIGDSRSGERYFATQEEAQSFINALPERIRQSKVIEPHQTMEPYSSSYQSSHWDEPNVLLHVRHNDRTVPGPNGEPMNALHLEEIQSDWHQAGRKQGYQDPNIEKLDARRREIEGYGRNATPEQKQEWADIMNRIRPDNRDIEGGSRFKGVPDAPFKTTWPDLALKRMLHRAATERNPDGSYKYDALSWTPGEAQAARYDLSQHVDRISYAKDRDGKWSFSARKGGNEVLQKRGLTTDEVGQHLGKEIADKMENGVGREVGAPEGSGELHGVNLKVGGEGMKSFYDKMLPDKANALVKKYGTRVQRSDISAAPAAGIDGPGWRVWEGDRMVANQGTREGAMRYMREGRRLEGPPTHKLHVIPITPALRAAAERGFPTFRDGGAVRGYQDGGTPDDIRPMGMAQPDVIGNRPDIQEGLREAGRGFVEPFEQLGRVMTGVSEEPLQDLTKAAIGAVGPPGARAFRPAVKAVTKATKPHGGMGAPWLGSMNPLDEAKFTWKGLEPHEWTPQHFEEVGKHFGVENLGPASKPQEFRYTNGTPFTIPGGVEGKFTYHDLLSMKAQGIDPSMIDRGLHTKIQQKIMRTMYPGERASDEQIWSGLVFGLTSPNNPLFPNQLTQSRLRLRDPKMIDQLAGMISWKPGENVGKAERMQAAENISNAFGLSSAEKGGLGTRGSQDYTRVAELAKMFKEDPSFFRKTPGESWPDFVERVSSQVAGLQMKTGSFASVWQDPGTAAISAIDRHMAQQFERTGGLFRDEVERMRWENKLVDRWNKANPDRQLKNFYEMRKTPGTEGLVGKALLEYVGNAEEKKFRLASGEINPSAPEHLRNTKWVAEPEKYLRMGEAYRRALDINDKVAKEHGLGLFASQWMEWDRIRRRLEPHENMFPGLEKMPAMSREQLREGPLAEHSASGHMDYSKLDAQGRPLKEIPEEERAYTQTFLKPTKPRPSPARFGYFGIPAAAVLGEGVVPKEQRASGGRVLSHYVEKNPSPAQIKAGNYRKAHISVHGLPIAIENPKGSTRYGIDKDGRPWAATVGANYGYLKRTTGADGDHVDCYVGPYTASKKVFIIDQKDAEDGTFDEHKCMLGFGSRQHAIDRYLSGFADGKGRRRLGRVTEMTIDQFKTWLRGDTTRPLERVA